MSGLVEISVDVVVEAPPQAVFDALVDWERQGEWMLGTRVRGTAADGVGVGGGIEAFTGVGRLGFLDTMVITDWDPPNRVAVVHTGNVVRGTGLFDVVALPSVDGRPRTRFVWSERLDLPLGLLGRIGWPLVKPPFRAGVAASLRRFARLVEAEQRPA